MRLIHVRTLKIEIFEGDDDLPRYAILSHRWAQGQEVLLRDLLKYAETGATRLEGWNKIKNCCAQALQDGLEYVWVDTCCINKESSAELSEAINSMFRWYHSATCCYAYLRDVTIKHETPWKDQFLSSEWFKRAWTLQELLAPARVEFFDREWKSLGSRLSLVNEISLASGISRAVFDTEPLGLSDWSVAQRMSWASCRVATRVEDIAYSLLGIFDVNMPLLYGEGQKAFLRLQEEIIRRTHDHSIFAWSGQPSEFASKHALAEIFATSPAAFEYDSDVVQTKLHTISSYSLTNLGLQIKLHVRPWGSGVFLAALDCARGSDKKQIGIFMISRVPGASLGVRALVQGRTQCLIREKEPLKSRVRDLILTTQVSSLTAQRLQLAMDKPSVKLHVDIRSITESLDHTLSEIVVYKHTENAEVIRRSSSLHCFGTVGNSYKLSDQNLLTIDNVLSSEAPRHGIFCILMYPRGAKFINAIKLGMDLDGNPVCVLADAFNKESRDRKPKIDQYGFPHNNLTRSSYTGDFWQWNCLERANWISPSSRGRDFLPVQHPPPYLREGLWALRARYDRSCFFRLPLGKDAVDGSVIVQLEVSDTSVGDTLYWTFSMQWELSSRMVSAPV